MNFSWFAKVIQKVGASNKKRVKNRIRSNSRGVVRQYLRGFESLEDRRVLASYVILGTGVVQLSLGANESVTVTTSANVYNFSLNSGVWSGPAYPGFFGAGVSVLNVNDTPSVSIVDTGAGSSVTFGGSVNFVASFSVALTNAAAGSITFNSPTNFVDTVSFGTPSFSASTTRNIVVNSGANISTVTGSLSLSANQQATGTAGTFAGIDVNSATISTSGTGALSIAGKGGATSGVGVLVRGTGIVETTGNSSITVNGATGASASFGVQLAGTSIVRKSTGTGSITLIGDTMDIGATSAINAGTANTVNLRQRTGAVAINIGGADTLAATPVLGLTDIELDLIAAATVNIGNASSGPISVSAVVSPLNYKTLALGNNTTFGAASGFISDVGPTLATFEKIAVTGTVAITAGATFTPVAAGYVPVLLDSFRFLDNDLTDTITGTFTVPSLTNFLGSTFTASASHAAGTGNDFVIAVPRNNAPTFNVGANQLVNQDSGAQTIVGWATGITSGGDPLPVQTLTFTTSGFNASLFLVAPAVSPTTGTLTYTPNPAAFGTTTVTLTLQDSGGTLNGGVDTTTKTFSIRINALPISVDDTGATTELGTATGNVLSNDSDPDTGETATLVVAAPGTFNGTFGTLTLAANGTYSYVANANQLTLGQTVTDSFTYRAKDVNAALGNVVSLVITITGENDAPVAANNAAATTELGTTTGSGSVLSNDTDPDTGETATLVVDVPGTFVGTFGTLTLGANGAFSYTANANQLTVGQTVTDSFTYQARDVNGTLSNVATLVVTITGENDVPVAANDAGATTELGTTSGSGSILSNDTDPDTGETATLVVDVPGTFVGTFGTLTLAANGTYSYTATANQIPVGQTVTDSFAYKARDVNGGLSNVASLVITITGENDAPVATNDVGATTELGTTTGSVLSNDTDSDTGETATLVVDVPGTFAGTNGTLTLGANGAFSYTANANQLTVGQTVTDSFTYQARDVNGTLSNVATLVVTITGENDTPTAANDAGATTELGTTTGSGSILSNDTDPDTGETASLVVDVPGTFVGTFGTLTLVANGTYSYTANANQLTVGQTVTDSFAYKARDVNGGLSNVASLVITLTGENDTPTAANDAGATTELGTTTGAVLSNDTDPDTGETATLVVEIPGTFTTVNGVLTLAANGTYSYTASANQLTVGQQVTDSFTYKAKDVNGALSNVATLVITITGENDAPVATNDVGATTELGTTTGSVLSNDTDADAGETATLVVDVPGTFTGTNGTLTLGANGAFSYTANPNQLTVGQTVTDSFTYQARDVNGTLSNLATLVVTITGQNDVPVAANDAGATTELGTTTGSGSILSNDTDPDTGETATLVVDVPGTFVGTFGTLTLAANGTYSYTANANQLTVGQTVTDSFVYKARDVNGGLSNVASLVVTITGENDVPVAANDAAATTETGTTTGSGSVLSNDTDPDTSESATLVVDAPGTFVGTYGTLTLAANGTFSYVANANQLAAGQTVTDSFNYRAKDVNGALSNVASLVITVTGENDAPVVSVPIADMSFTPANLFLSNAASSYSFPAGTFTDVDVSDVLTYAATLDNGNALPSWLSFNALTRTFSGTPSNANLGALQIKVTATDPGSLSVSDTFQLSVVDTTVPTLGAVKVTRSTWAPAYKNLVDAVFADPTVDKDFVDGVGYAIPTDTPANQLKPLTWLNINELVLSTSEVVQGSGSGGAFLNTDIQLLGINTANYSGAISSIVYDPLKGGIVINFNTSLPTDRYTIVSTLGTVKDNSGNNLAALNFSFNVLVGDFNQSGAVGSFDFINTRNAQGSEVGDAAYSFLMDIDGNGAIGSFDFINVRNRQGDELP